MQILSNLGAGKEIAQKFLKKWAKWVIGGNKKSGEKKETIPSSLKISGYFDAGREVIPPTVLPAMHPIPYERPK